MSHSPFRVQPFDCSLVFRLMRQRSNSGEIHAEISEPGAQAVLAHDSIDEPERLELTHERSLVKYERTDTPRSDFIEQRKLLSESPITGQNG